MTNREQNIATQEQAVEKLNAGDIDGRWTRWSPSTPLTTIPPRAKALDARVSEASSRRWQPHFRTLT